MTHKHSMQVGDVDVKAILILAQPTDDVKQKLPQDVPVKEVKEETIYDDYDDTMDEFLHSLGGFDKKDQPLVGEMGVKK